MREILFRAYDKGRKEYLSNGNLFISINKSRHPNKSEIYLDEIGNADKYNERFVIEQYTGLTDKNGKRIFEGDILESEHGKEKFVIGYNERFGGFVAYESMKRLSWEFIDEIGKIEIIGNVNDNPELLKGGAE